SPLLHADHTLLLARPIPDQASVKAQPDNTPTTAPSGLVFNRRRWPSIHPAPTVLQANHAGPFEKGPRNFAQEGTTTGLTAQRLCVSDRGPSTSSRPSSGDEPRGFALRAAQRYCSCGCMVPRRGAADFKIGEPRFDG